MKLYKNLATALKERSDVHALKLILKGSDFPLELFDFPHLKELYLEGECQHFSLPLDSWKELKILSIKWEAFQGDLSSLFGLNSLENLKIIETPLESILLPLGLIQAPLKSLTIKNAGLKNIPEEISMLTNLKEMYLPGNCLSKLPHAFRELQNLGRLNLDHNQFEKFPDVVKHMPKLGHLSIDGNPFSQEEKERIQREFHIWPN